MKTLFHHRKEDNDVNNALKDMFVNEDEKKKETVAKFLDLVELEVQDKEILGEDCFEVEDGTLKINLTEITKDQWEALKRTVKF